MSKDFDPEEIKRRQKELVEMKQVKQGQKEAPLVDLEAEKLLPKTPKEKWKNFWFQYKWIVVVTVVVVGLVTFFTVDLLTKEKYDLNIIAANRYQVDVANLGISTAEQRKTFEAFAHDIDGNGKVAVGINSIQMIDRTSSGVTDLNMVQASSTKLIASLQIFEGFIFIMDQQTYDSITIDAETGEKLDAFYDLSQYTAQNKAFQGDKIYLKDTHLADKWGFKEVPDDLFLCLRDYSKYDGKKEKIEKKYQEEKKVFDKIVQSVLENPKQGTESSKPAAETSKK